MLRCLDCNLKGYELVAMRNCEDHGRAKLSNEDVRVIRKLCTERLATQAAIGWLFDINQNTVSAIHTRRIWKDLPAN
jgi:hypothetical protein